MLQNDPSFKEDKLIPYIRAVHVKWGDVSIDDLPEIWANQAEFDKYCVLNGNLIVCEGREVERHP